MPPKSITFFSEESVGRLKKLEGKILTDVNHYLWINNAKPSEPLEFIDWVELIFKDGTIMIMTAGRESDGIKLPIHFDFAHEQEKIFEQFGHQIHLQLKNMSQSTLWSPTINVPLGGVYLMTEDDKHYQNQAVLLDFNGDIIEVFTNYEGLGVEVYDPTNGLDESTDIDEIGEESSTSYE